jgi:hypothetical protein
MGVLLLLLTNFRCLGQVCKYISKFVIMNEVDIQFVHLIGKSECDGFSVLLANIQFQVTCCKVWSMVYMLKCAIILSKGVFYSGIE